jgi:hypothetical protein
MKPGITLKSPLRIQHGGAEFFNMNNAQYFLDKVLKPNLKEQIGLLPDSVFIGALLLALLTQSYSMTIFAVSLLEAGIVGAGLRKLFTYLDLVHTAPLKGEDPTVCTSSYTTPTIESLIMFSTANATSALPSSPIFILTTATSYIIGSMYSQKQELEALGPAYSARFYIAIAASTLLLFAVSMYRMSNSCEGLGVILMSIILGIIVGGLIVFQNNQLFGRDATNLTGIPLLKERTRDGRPLYVCPQKTRETSK